MAESRLALARFVRFQDLGDNSGNGLLKVHKDETLSRAASQAAESSDFGLSLEISVSEAHASRVRGEMAVLARHLTPAGTVHIGTVVGFAEELIAHGSHHHGAAGTIELKTNFYRPRDSKRLIGEATPLLIDSRLMVWQTAIFDETGAQTALLSQTLLRSGKAEAVAYAQTSRQLNAALQQAAPDEAAPARMNGGATIADQRREQIAAAACDVIATKGFDAATIREIATAAGLHVPTMYQYVSGKDEILELVYNWVMTHLKTDVDTATKGCKTARDKILATVAAMIENGNRYPRQVGVLNRELKSLSPEARRRVLDEYQALLGRIAELVAEGVARGEFRDVEPMIAANWIEAICDVWPLRQFSVRKFGLKRYQQEAAAFIDNSLVLR